MEPDQDTVPFTKPGSVNTAVYLIIAAVLLGILYALINAVWNWSEVARYYGNAFVTICIGFDYLFAIFLAYKIGLGRNWARILYLLGPLFKTANFVLNAAEYRNGLPLTLIPIVQVILEWNAIVLLFQSPANDWFRNQKAGLKKTTENVAKAQTAEVKPSPTTVNTVASRLFNERDPPWSMAKIVTIAGAIGAALGLVNSIFWTLYWSPHSANERQMIYVQLIAGSVVGAVWGTVGGFVLLQLTRKNRKRSPLRWAILGGFLGRPLSFTCGFMATIFAGF